MTWCSRARPHPATPPIEDAIMRLTALLFAVLLLSACSRDATPPAAATPPPATTPAPEPAPIPTLPSPVTRAPTFVGAWRADSGSGVEAGTRYFFDADGTLRIESPNGTPMVGAWRFVDGALTMTEEGIDYPTDIVAQDPAHLHLRSHNPGGVVELVLVRE
jgi:hypothetical protein